MCGVFLCQDKSIEEQLSMGIRYFDLRIAHKPNDPSSDLYFTHVIYTHLTVLVSLLTWIKCSPFFRMFLLNIFLHRKPLCLLPPGWSFTRRRLLYLLAAISREWMRNATSRLFSPWRSCSARNSVPRRSVFSLCGGFTRLKQTLCLIASDLPSTAVCPDLEESVGIWLPGHSVLRVPDCSKTSGAVAQHPVLVGEPAHSTGSDQLPGVAERSGASWWV